ncbi:MAG: PLP-dependent aminotransferase family protein [bacterium]|nr:MAG: PLP-dependent aminotransferase family protein [bacterium]
MVLLKIEKQDSKPVFRQIIDQVIELIENKSLKEGDSLPSTRNLADTLGLDRSTVYRSYLELTALGYLESCPGSYTRVRKRARVVTETSNSEPGILDWSIHSNSESNQLYDFFLKFKPETAVRIPDDLINLSPLDLDHRIFPVDDFRRCLNQVLVNLGPKILRYGSYQGDQNLREDIARRLQIHGISISRDEVLVTNGAQNAIELVLKLLGKPGEYVAIESPTYANVIPLIRHHGMNLLEIPVNDQGMDLDQLEQMISKRPPILVYTIPNFQNPTGITTDQPHRERLLGICERYKIPLVEDGFEEEMKYFGKAVLPIKSMDRKKIVIYLGTFSKVLFPGIRVGWIAAEKECINRLTSIKRFVDLSSSSIIQAAVSAFIRGGYYDKHLKKMHRIFRKRMTTTLTALKIHLPPHVKWTKPDGGYTIWVSLPWASESEREFVDTFIKNGVLVSPGLYYFFSSHSHRYFRISISSLNEDEITEGVRRLGKSLQKMKEQRD